MEPSLFVAAVLVVAGVLALEFGISSAALPMVLLRDVPAELDR